MVSIEVHRKKREEVYSELTDFWHDLNGSEYALYDFVLMTEQEISEIKEATNRIGQIFFKTAKLLRNSEDPTLLQLDIPKEILPFIRHQSLPVEAVIARIDLVKTENGLKILELNADTPTFEKEVFHVNAKMCREFSLTDPNQGLEIELGKAIKKAIGEACFRTKQAHEPYVVFTSHGDHIEDKYTTTYLMELSDLQARYCPLEKLRIVKNVGLFDDSGRKIDVLYRQTYPLEQLILDRDEASQDKVGIQLLELVIAGKLVILNPISSFLLQSKAILAVIWGLLEMNSPYFSEEEKEWIQLYFLPTYLEEDHFLKSEIKYVKKPSFGREGDTVEIYEGMEKIAEDTSKTYASSLPIYQQYVELPSHPIQTTNGKKMAKLLIGSFLINGKASGIGIRAGNQITDNGAYFLPLGIKP
ncbi:glutathionylspermidine synthase family protein [Metabacillus herbersteinensis]|uniref:Glutathionylspermidine synthase family protein n=1 Tax=Metabacillus herbersteinensis TaxID=283816 RepID=A0ABV6GGA2_9BACI